MRNKFPSCCGYRYQKMEAKQMLFVEERMLNDTLASLRSTSKGKLKYNRAMELERNHPETFSNSLESFISRSPESLRLITDIYTSGNLHDNESSSQNGVENTNDTSYENITPVKGLRPQNRAEINGENTKSNSVSERREKAVAIAPNIENRNELSLKEYHIETRKIAESKKQERAKILQSGAKNLREETRELLELSQKHFDAQKKRFRSGVLEKMNNDMESLKRRKEAMDNKAMEHKRFLDEIYTRALIEESHVAQQEEERKAALENLKRNIMSLHNQILKKVAVIQRKFQNFPHMQLVNGNDYQGVTSAISKIVDEAESVVGKSKTVTDLSIAESNIGAMNNLIEKTMAIDTKGTEVLKVAEEKLSVAVRKKKMEEAAKLEKKQLKKDHVTMKTETDAKAAKDVVDAGHIRSLSSSEHSSKTKSKEDSTEAARCISDKAFSEYLKLQDVLKSVQDSFKDFASDPKYTKYKFDLQKAVNVPINALSAQSPSHLNDKIHRLVTLLAGHNVLVVGKSINCKSHQSAMAYCKDLVARKLVMQGAQQVSSNPGSAFIYAAVIIGIWSAFPDVGELILAHFQHSYPFLVPYYMPIQNGQSTTDYHKALGYSVVHNKVEDEDNFLKKFSGTVQLYAAVLSSSTCTEAGHPYGIGHGWTWLARVLNMKPHPSVTATMLYEFIKVAGHMLFKRYGSQFQKILVVLWKEFVPAIDKVTPPDKKGPTQRLKDFLEECIHSYRIPVPDGYLTSRWWQSGAF